MCKFSQPYLDVFPFLSTFLLLCLEYPLPLYFSPYHLALSNHSYPSRLSLSVFVFRKPFFTSTLSVKLLQEPLYCPTFEVNPTHFLFTVVCIHIQAVFEERSSKHQSTTSCPQMEINPINTHPWVEFSWCSLPTKTFLMNHRPHFQQHCSGTICSFSSSARKCCSSPINSHVLCLVTQLCLTLCHP